jgi:hypothetical protein
MGIGQVLTMPIFFASTHVNPLTYQVDILRALMLVQGTSEYGFRCLADGNRCPHLRCCKDVWTHRTLITCNVRYRHKGDIEDQPMSPIGVRSGTGPDQSTM